MTDAEAALLQLMQSEKKPAYAGKPGRGDRESCANYKFHGKSPYRNNTKPKDTDDGDA